MKTYTAESVIENLQTSDAWVARAVVAIFNKQTEAEKQVSATVEHNGVGFNAIDAEILSDFARFYLQRGYMTPKQVALARKKMPKYAGQLVRIANKEI